MGRRPEEAERRRRSSWPVALLVAIVLSSGFRLTQAQEIPVTVEPAKPLEGQDLTLTPGGTPTFFLCNWFRGEERVEANRIFSYVLSSLSSPKQQNGLGFTGRETGGPGCSLHIRNLMLSDTGVYVVSKAARGGFEGQRVQIGVSEKLLPPVLRPAELFVEEHADVTLSCTTSERSRVTVFWFKDGKAVPAKAARSERNRALTIPDVSRDDEGMYTCRAWNPGNSAMSNPSKIAVTRARSRKNKSSKEMNPTSPVYANMGPSAQVTPVNSSEINNSYEELQHRSQDVYDQLRW